MKLQEVLDFVQLEKILEYFSEVTELDVALHDPAGVVLIACRKSGTICELVENYALCHEHLAYGGKKSMELGEPYIYTCGCGLVMCSSPVVFNEALIGSFVCGPLMLWEADEIAMEEISQKTANMNLMVSEELFKCIPNYECTKVTAAAQLLFIMVNSLTMEHSKYLRQREQITQQQAKIAELIIEKKTVAAGFRGIERHSHLTYPLEKEKELIAFVHSGKKQQATALLNDILSIIFSAAEGGIDTIRVRLFELLAFLSRAAVGAGAPLNEVNTITREAFEICEEHTSFEQLCFLTTQAMERFVDTIYRNREQKQTSLHLTKAIEYIQEHYMKDLPLLTVASSVHVSEYYLSHLFRKEMNQTFSDYVAKVRIEKAQDFLRENPSARIQEIADKTGFNDPNYFSKIFKKYTGVSPKEYQVLFK